MIKLIDENFIVTGAIDTLRKGLIVIEERDAVYNRNDIHFEDYCLSGLESTWKNILECFVRCWNTHGDDSKVDWTVYSALQANLVAAGIPQSRFAPIFQRYLPEMYEAMKARDEMWR